MPNDAGAGADRSYAVLLSSLLALRSDPATDHFDVLLSRLEASAQLDPALARELRWWQRESVRGVEDYVASTLPVLLSSVDRARLDAAETQAMAARSWHLAAPTAEPVASPTPASDAPPPAEPGATAADTAPMFVAVVDPAAAVPAETQAAQLPPRASFPAPSGLVTELPPPSPFAPGPATVPPPDAAAENWQRNDRRKNDRRDPTAGTGQAEPTADRDRQELPGTNVTVTGSWPLLAAESHNTFATVLDVVALEVIAPPPTDSPSATPSSRFLWSRLATAPDPASAEQSDAGRSVIDMPYPDPSAPARKSAQPPVVPPPLPPEVLDLRTPGMAAEDSRDQQRPSARRRLLVTGLTVVNDRPTP